MPLSLSRERAAAVERIRREIMSGATPLIDHALIVETSAVVAAAATGSVITQRPYEDGLIVSLDGLAYDPAGGAESDTMDGRMHDKFMGVKLVIGGRPKTNDTFEPLWTLVPKKVCWVVAQGDLIQATPKHLADSGIASLHLKLSLGFIPFSDLGI